MKKLFILLRKASYGVALLVLYGCSSTVSTIDDPQYIGSVAKPHEIVEPYPMWVVVGSDYFRSPTGVACEALKGGSFEDLHNSKKLAHKKARLELFRLAGGREKLSAKESIKVENQQKDYSLEISTSMSGRIGRNDILEEVELKRNGTTEYCVAIGLI